MDPFPALRTARAEILEVMADAIQAQTDTGAKIAGATEVIMPPDRRVGTFWLQVEIPVSDGEEA